LEYYEQNVLHAAIKDALQMGAISFDAIKHREYPRLCVWGSAHAV
jgi:hypothetical protein